MKEFGRLQFENTAYITFDNNQNLIEQFNGSLSPKRLLPILQAESGTVINSNTLLILDEIQESPRALQSLKYFCEEAPEIPLIAAGSALGLTLHSATNTKQGGHTGASFPVGKVNFLDMYPMCFLEFLYALGEDALADLLTALDWEAIAPFHEKLLEHLRQYMFVGGMPEAVATYANSRFVDDARAVQNDLLRAYNLDFSKYATPIQSEKIREVWRAIPANLAKENRKFIFSKIKESARARDYEQALQWLMDTSLICVSACVKSPEIPLASHAESKIFKVYTLDVGLLGAMNGTTSKSILSNAEIFSSYKGSLAEQFVAQELLASGQAGNSMDPTNKLHYFMNQSTRTEVDFIVDGNNLNSAAVPIEVKSGTNLQAKSLTAYCNKYKPELAMRTSTAKAVLGDQIQDIPLYAFGAYFRKYVSGVSH
jgi:hypothetical protein